MSGTQPRIEGLEKQGESEDKSLSTSDFMGRLNEENRIEKDLQILIEGKPDERGKTNQIYWIFENKLIAFDAKNFHFENKISIF